MKIVARSAAAGAGVLLALLFLGSQVQARPEYAQKEKKACSFCHVGKPADMKFTKAGEYYSTNHTLKGFRETGEKAPSPGEAPPSGGGAPKPSGDAPSSSGDTRSSADGTSGGGMASEGMMQGPGGMHPCQSMMEEMKAHAAEMQKAIDALQEHEKALETLGDWPQARPVIVEHLRMIDNVVALRAKPLRMMERMHRKDMMEGPGDASSPPASGGGKPAR